MSKTEPCFGWLIPIGHDGKDVALFPLKRQLYVIGSAEGVNIRIPYKGIHPWHVSIIVDSNGSVSMRNLHHSRYFIVNGKHEPNMIQLHNLDIIQLARHTFRFENASSTPSLDKAAPKASPKPKHSRVMKTSNTNSAEDSKHAANLSSSPLSPLLTGSTVATTNTPAVNPSANIEETIAPINEEPKEEATVPANVPTQELELFAVELLAAPTTTTSATEEEVQIVNIGEEDEHEISFSQHKFRAPPSSNIVADTSTVDDGDAIQALQVDEDKDEISWGKHVPKSLIPTPATETSTVDGEEEKLPLVGVERPTARTHEATKIDAEPLEGVAPLAIPNQKKSRASAANGESKKGSSSSAATRTDSRASRKPTRTLAPRARARSLLRDSDDEECRMDDDIDREKTKTEPRAQRSTRRASLSGRKPSASTAGGVLSDDMFEHKDLSTIVDDEGRLPTSCGLDDLFCASTSSSAKSANNAKSRSSASKSALGNAQNGAKKNSKKRARTSAPSSSESRPSARKPHDSPDSDVDMESTANPKRRAPSTRNQAPQGSASDATSYAPPLASDSSPTKQKLHIVTQLLKKHGTLTHTQVMKYAAQHAPYKKALDELRLSNWRTDLVFSLGNTSFMPDLIRDGTLVSLPTHSNHS